MKKLTIFLFASFLFFQLSAQQIIDPNAEVRAASGFHGIRVSNAFDVYISQGSTEAVAVSAASTKDRDKIKVEVKDGVLDIRLDSDWKINTGNKKLKAYITYKAIDQMHISGACDVFINGVMESNELSIKLSGASDLKGKLGVQKLSVNLSGASDMTVSGKADQLHVEASGASDFKGYDLVTETCDATASGASDIKITVNKELSAQASGASDVRYRGTGVVRELKNSGSSSVTKG